MQKEINQLANSSSVTSLEEMRKELDLKFNGAAKMELQGDFLHVKISGATTPGRPILHLETIKKVIDILIQTKNQKYKNLKVSVNNDVVVVEK